jgi:vesicle coat complex subunit
MSQLASSNDKNCTFLISTEKASSISQDEVCKMIEDSNVDSKIIGLKGAITGMLSGEAMPRVLMAVIR